MNKIKKVFMSAFIAACALTCRAAEVNPAIHNATDQKVRVPKLPSKDLIDKAAKMEKFKKKLRNSDENDYMIFVAEKELANEQDSSGRTFGEIVAEEYIEKMKTKEYKREKDRLIHGSYYWSYSVNDYNLEGFLRNLIKWGVQDPTFVQNSLPKMVELLQGNENLEGCSSVFLQIPYKYRQKNTYTNYVPLSEEKSNAYLIIRLFDLVSCFAIDEAIELIRENPWLAHVSNGGKSILYSTAEAYGSDNNLAQDIKDDIQELFKLLLAHGAYDTEPSYGVWSLNKLQGAPDDDFDNLLRHGAYQPLLQVKESYKQDKTQFADLLRGPQDRIIIEPVVDEIIENHEPDNGEGENNNQPNVPENNNVEEAVEKVEQASNLKNWIAGGSVLFGMALGYWAANKKADKQTSPR